MKKFTPKSTVVVVDTEAASRELTGVRRAAMTAAKRLSALEEQAETIHAKTLLSCTARVPSSKDGGIHALLTDEHGVTVEIAGGELAVAVAKPD